MAKATSHLWHPFNTVLQKGGSSYEKYHIAKMAPNMNGISQLYYWFSKLLQIQHLAGRTYPYN